MRAGGASLTTRGRRLAGHSDAEFAGEPFVLKVLAVSRACSARAAIQMARRLRGWRLRPPWFARWFRLLFGLRRSTSTASGAPGDDVSVVVSLHTMGAMVVSTLNRIDFSRVTPVAATTRGFPDCVVNPAIEKAATAFRFLPVGCNPAVDSAHRCTLW